jgi:hypothetical protein
MSEKIKITCPRCGHKWEKSMPELEKVEVIYRGGEKAPPVEIGKYRAVCPVDGTYVILEIQED